MSKDSDRIEHILEAIESIERYSSKGPNEFYKNELIQSWIVRHLQILGEAANRLSPSFRESHPDIPWKKIIGMRNIIVHDYFKIDADAVWGVVDKDLMILKVKIQNMTS